MKQDNKGSRDLRSELLLRATLPKALGVAALFVLIFSIGAMVFFLVRRPADREFRMQGFPTSLSTDVVAIVEGYERREMDGDVTRYLLRADRATSFADNHQELENVHLEVFDESGAASDQIAARKAVYIPVEPKLFKAYFAGAVRVETRDGLKVETEQLSYDKGNEVALAEEVVTFSRSNVSGSSFGASIRPREKTLELFRDVRIEALGSNGSEQTVLHAGRAEYFQEAERIELDGSVRIESTAADSRNARTLSAARAKVDLQQGPNGDRIIKRFELSDNVDVTTTSASHSSTNIRSGHAVYLESEDRYDLNGDVHITTVEGGRVTEIRADSAVYRQSARLADLAGNCLILQQPSTVRGQKINAILAGDNSISRAEVTGNAQVVQTLAERTSTFSGDKIVATFAGGQLMERAQIVGNGSAVIVPSNPTEYSKLTLAAPKVIDISFVKGLLNTVVTSGRTNVTMEAQNRSPEASNRALSADSITTRFNSSGSDISHVLAKGNAELKMVPLTPSAGTYTTTVSSPLFDCDFFEKGNDPKKCVAQTNARTVRVPTQASVNRGTQTITSTVLNAYFSEATRDIETLEAVGKARFTELERNASSERIIYTPGNQFVKLRGGDPNVWDDRARARAPEIDWDMANQRSELRGGVSTTYFRSASNRAAMPFGSSGSPIYVTARQAQFDHKADVAYYDGNVRGWQDRNYVRGERMYIDDRKGQFRVEENVQSFLYNSKRSDGGSDSLNPVHAAADRMFYERDTRLIRYESSVDIRQGKDRVTGGAAKIALSENNDATVTEVERNVSIVTPNRRATADFARYDNLAETLLLRGTPAVIDDRDQGRSQAAEFVLNFKEDRFLGTSPATRTTTGRIRSVYRVNKN